MATIATLSVVMETKGQRQFLRGMAGSAAAVAAVVVAMDRFLDRGGKVASVQRAFTTLTRGQTDAISQLRTATSGLVGNYDLMQQANTAITLGAAENVEQFAEMARGAQVLGRALGLDATFALNSLTTGIGRQSRMMLDNLGIIVDAESAQRKYAEALGVAASELTELQRKEAFRAEAMAQLTAATDRLGGLVFTQADAWRALRIELGNTFDLMASGAAEGSVLTTWLVQLRAQLVSITQGAAAGAAVLADYVNALNDAADAAANTIPDASMFIRELGAAVKEAGQSVTPEATTAWKEYQATLFTVGVEANITKDAVKKLAEDGMRTVSRETLIAQGKFLALENQTKSLRSEMRGLASDLSAVAGILGFIPGFGAVGSFIGQAASFAGLAGRFLSDDPISAAKDAKANLSPAQTGGITINVGPAADPISLARDQQWLRGLRESMLNLQAQGA